LGKPLNPCTASSRQKICFCGLAVLCNMSTVQDGGPTDPQVPSSWIPGLPRAPRTPCTQ
jgi:hypothetical protein